MIENKQIKNELIDVISKMVVMNRDNSKSIEVYGYTLQINYYKDDDLLVFCDGGIITDCFHIAYPCDEFDSVEDIVDGALSDWKDYIKGYVKGYLQFCVEALDNGIKEGTITDDVVKKHFRIVFPYKDIKLTEDKDYVDFAYQERDRLCDILRQIEELE